MAIVVRLDRVMADRKVRLSELAEYVGITPSNLSRIKSGHAVSLRFSTLDKLCEFLNCQPGDLLEYSEEPSNYKDSRKTGTVKQEKSAGIPDFLNYS